MLQIGNATRMILCDWDIMGFTSHCTWKRTGFLFCPCPPWSSCCHHLLYTCSGLLSLCPSVPLPASPLRFGSDIHASDTSWPSLSPETQEWTLWVPPTLKVCQISLNRIGCQTFQRKACEVVHWLVGRVLPHALHTQVQYPAEDARASIMTQFSVCNQGSGWLGLVRVEQWRTSKWTVGYLFAFPWCNRITIPWRWVPTQIWAAWWVLSPLKHQYVTFKLQQNLSKLVETFSP